MIRMDSNLTISCDCADDDVDEDYIDMVISCPSPNQLCCPCSAQGREFEFQNGKETITSPADCADDDVDEGYIDMVISCQSSNQLWCPCSSQGREFEFQNGKEVITSPADCADDDVDENYIDMVISCASPNQIYCPCSPQVREFEFQNAKEAITSPADDLFYKGKLLPLHLPPRLQMVEGLLHVSTMAVEGFRGGRNDDYYSMPFSKCPTEPCTNGTNTPLGSANMSPSESCRVSCELIADDYFLEWSARSSSIIVDQPDKWTWSNKLRTIKHSILGNKLKAPRAYFKSLFSKSVGPDKPQYQKVSNNAGPESAQKPEDKYSKVAKKISFGLMKEFDKKGIGNIAHRKSFSGIIRCHSTNMCLSSSSSESSSSSSSFSLDSGGFHGLHFLSRTSGEGSIEAAIAYCKKSQQWQQLIKRT